ncbi:MAG: phosphoribosylformylglycinamidine cyclo-ligase [Actinomycetota bacterium]|nr:phosphoribosylformylglycinamidine cyclo-ligase [Actinomycetota bacterium]
MPDYKEKISYKKSGVDIDKAAETLNAAKQSITSTFSGQVLNDLSAFAGLYKPDLDQIDNPVLVSSTDGVGTKLLLAKKLNDYTRIGQDLVGMCINDILCCGAKPLFFLDYIACGKIDKQVITAVIKSIADSCKECDSALIGGETAEMPGMYQPDEIDLAGFAVGIASQEKIIKPDMVDCGDIIIGIGSSGLHSNGYSLVRQIIKESSLDLDQIYFGDRTLAREVLEPTRLYWPLLKQVIHDQHIPVHGIAHITGGGFYDNINRAIPSGTNACIKEGSWPVKPVFKFLMDSADLDKKEMYRVFNMGIGLVLIVDKSYLGRIKSIAKSTGDTVYNIGCIGKGTGKVKIEFQQ